MFITEQRESVAKSTTLDYQTDLVKEYRFKNPAGYRADRDLNLAHFKEMMTIFQNTADENGQLNMDDFLDAFQGAIPNASRNDLRLLFLKIDINTDNFVCWEEFSSFLLLQAEGEKQMTAVKVGEFTRDDRIPKSPHKEMIVNIQYIKSSKKYMTCCRAGTITYWSDKFKILKIFPNAGQLQVEKTTATTRQQSFQGTKFRWINAALFCESLQKIILASDDHQISIYDSSNLARILSFDLEHHNALALEYHPLKDTAQSMLIYSTDSGHVCVYTLDEEYLLQNLSRLSEGIFIEREDIPHRHKLLGSIWKKKIHADWSLDVIYVPDLRILISCSPDPNKSLSIARYGNNQSWSFKSASITKGVTCVAFSPSPQVVITAGMDKIIRIWNPLHKTLHPTGSLKGHSTAIVKLVLSSESGLMISLSVSKTVKIWDIKSHNLLQTLPNSVLQFPDDYLSNMIFNQENLSIITVSSGIHVYRLKGGKKVTEKSHEYPVRNILYNSVFNQVVSGCDGSVINIWDLETGQRTFKIEKVHETSEITALCFETSGRRLITGGRDGSVRIWNHNNGALLQELKLDEMTEVTAIKFAVLEKVPYVVVTGWDKKISFFLDTTPENYVIHPEYSWPSREQFANPEFNWHQDDILSLELLPPSIFASSSYSGDIIISNLNTGEIIHHLNPHQYQPADFPKPKRSIDKILFLNTRESGFDASSLITAGGDGIIRFWNPVYDLELASKSEVYAMTLNELQNRLLVGDSKGTVTIFDTSQGDTLTRYTIQRVNSFKAHPVPIADICAMNSFIITSASDCNVRLFTDNGNYIGTFGQHRLWDLLDFRSFGKRPDDITESISELENAHSAESIKNDELLDSDVNNPDEKLDNQPLNSWFAQSLFAKQRILTRMPVLKATPLTASMGDIRQIHNLEEVPVMTFKSFKLSG